MLKVHLDVTFSLDEKVVSLSVIVSLDEKVFSHNKRYVAEIQQDHQPGHDCKYFILNIS